MKKLIIFLIFSISLFQYSYAKEYWRFINKNVSYHKNFGIGNMRTGFFKITNNTDEYEILKFKTYCKEEILHLEEESYYRNNKLLYKEINQSNVSCDYTGIANGEFYYIYLCKK